MSVQTLVGLLVNTSVCCQHNGYLESILPLLIQPCLHLVSEQRLSMLLVPCPSFSFRSLGSVRAPPGDLGLRVLRYHMRNTPGMNRRISLDQRTSRCSHHLGLSRSVLFSSDRTTNTIVSAMRTTQQTTFHTCAISVLAANVAIPLTGKCRGGHTRSRYETCSFCVQLGGCIDGATRIA
jgi:hypothetical protein